MLSPQDCIRELQNTQLLLKREQTLNKQLRVETKALQTQVAELRSWRADQDTFECDVATAVSYTHLTLPTTPYV